MFYFVFDQIFMNYLILGRLYDLVSSGEGLAILDQGSSFGAGNLIDFGINSNTSAKGFLKCTYKVSE